MKAVNLEKLLPHDIPAGEQNSLARQAAMDQPGAPRLSRRFCYRLFCRADRLERLFGGGRLRAGRAAARVAAKTVRNRRGGPRARRAPQLPLRAHDALRRDLSPPRHEDWRCAADLHQSPIQADRLRVHLRLRRRNGRHSGPAHVQRANWLFRAVAPRASFPFREPRALAAFRRQCRRCRRGSEPRASRSQRASPKALSQRRSLSPAGSRAGAVALPEQATA